MRKYLPLVLGVVAASLAGTGTAAADDVWPTRPVKLIVAFGPGGPTDLFARLIGQKLSQQTGKNFYIENAPGAGGNFTNNPYLFPHVPYDPIKSFDAVTLAAATPVVLAVNPSVPAQTVKELVALIRATPGKFSYASPGTGTPPQLVGALFRHSLDLDMVHVPFDGGGTAVVATIAGHTPVSFGAMAPAVPLIKDGKLRALAVTGNERSPTLPDIPTMAEAGFPEVDGRTWTAVVVPAGTPKDIIAKLHGLIIEDLAQPDVKEKLATIAYVPIGNSPDECSAFFKAEMTKWSKVIKDAGLKAE
jgi:tripartite-type tricarboxylate transporter receptor subunit TctC